MNVHLFNTDLAAGAAAKEKTSFLVSYNIAKVEQEHCHTCPTSSVLLPLWVTYQYHRMRSAQRYAWSRSLNIRTVKGGMEKPSCEDTCHLFQTAKQSSAKMILRVISQYGKEYAHAKDIRCLGKSKLWQGVAESDRSCGTDIALRIKMSWA